MNIKHIIKKINDQQNLSTDEMMFAMRSIMNDQTTREEIAEFLVGLQKKGESIEEITAAAKIVRAAATPVTIHHAKYLVDIVGTGGDQAKIFNVSTTSAFVIAAAGAQVIKHNNRAISSASGSADVLEFAGINLQLTPDQIADCVEKIGISFIFAPLHHLAWQKVRDVRRELKTRTIFNLLGPLTNPANAPNLLVGVYAKKWVESFAEVFRELGNQHVLVVHSEDGLDEISVAAPTFVAELKNNKIETYTIEPAQFGLKISSLDALRVKNSEESFILLQAVLNNQAGAARDIVLLNAGAAMYAANLVSSIAEGVEKAAAVIASGAAKKKLEDLKEFTQKFISK